MPGKGGFWSRRKMRLMPSWSTSSAERAASASSSSRCASAVRPSPDSAMARYRALLTGPNPVPGEAIAAAKYSRAFSESVGHLIIPSKG